MNLNRRDFLKALGVLFSGMFAWVQAPRQAEGNRLLEIETQIDHQTGIAGTVTNIVTGQPIAGARVFIENFRPTSTDALGRYALSVPPGTYEIHAQAPGFIAMSRVDQRIPQSSYLTTNFQVVPLNASEEDDRTIYEKLVVAPQSTMAEDDDLELGPSAMAVTVPTTIEVEIDGQCVSMDLEEYLKGVIPSEMPASWHFEALKAQTIVARSYAVAYYQKYGCICTSDGCQVYSNVRYESTNNAVDATRGQIITYGGNIVSTHYFSSCGGNGTRNSEDAILWKTCQPAGWGYVPYERARPCWGPHNPSTVGPCGYYGHGVGMCQWGARNRASEGWNYLDILNGYYTGIQIEGGMPPPPPPPSPPNPVSPPHGQFFLTGASVTVSWSAVAAATYYAEAQRSGGGWASQFGWTASTSWTLGSLPPGMYQWRVKAKNNFGESAFSQYAVFVIADRIYKTNFPRTDNGSVGNP